MMMSVVLPYSPVDGLTEYSLPDCLGVPSFPQEHHQHREGRGRAFRTGLSALDEVVGVRERPGCHHGQASECQDRKLQELPGHAGEAPQETEWARVQSHTCILVVVLGVLLTVLTYARV